MTQSEEIREEVTMNTTRHFRRQAPPGAPPGTLIPDPESLQTSICLISFGPAGMEEKPIIDPGEIPQNLAKWPMTWVNVEGLRDAATLKKLAEIFNIHSLAMEDVFNVHQRVKVELYGDQLFLVAKMLESKPHAELDLDQLSVFIGSNYVLTFQEKPGDGFGPIRERIRQGVGRLRHMGPDFLCYALLDAVIDAYFPALEAYGEQLDQIEEEVVGRPSRETVRRIRTIKRDLLQLRRAIWPLRETLSSLLRDKIDLITEDTRVYLRDCYDHGAQLIDLMEIYREVTSSLMDEYLSSLSNRLNEVMKVLTIIATIFMPLSFIASLYGMNFRTEVSPFNMPELSWRYGYPFSLSLMASVAVGFLIYFLKKGWLGSLEERGRRRRKKKRGMPPPSGQSGPKK